MKVIICYSHDFKDFINIMPFIIPHCNIVNSIDFNNIDFICIIYDKVIYKFNRYDNTIINIIQQRYDLLRFTSIGLWIENIDDRFSEHKYFSIERDTNRDPRKFFRNEKLNILHNVIIDDLFFKRYVYPDF